ncbi:hypothetical protein HYFRA_00007589 [Hymenoscyphus fraxineus]|uniref:Uncharacterized protein n=1 Tax=Hymenoscyphus fraxineus TaxID=746836 RepID=A0A9N9KVH5_9HELO|nr:hypothetical protein HYFRA_00007589 [Hymenoscyphus fraxineus]
MAKGAVQYTDYTLLFKHGKHTILLFAEATTPFTSLKTELLKTLRERYPSGLPQSDSDSNIEIPNSPAEVVLGVPNDAYDPSKGWSELDTGNGLKETPKSLGVKDGSMIAFVFVPEGEEDSEPEFKVEFCNLEELYPEEE